MSFVVTFERVTPIARTDGNAWTEARIEEAATETGSYAEIETIDLSTLSGGLDADPSNPATRTLTTEEATALNLWYRIIFVDADGDESTPTAPIQNVSPATGAYADVDELARILKIRNPTADQTNAMARVLLAAAGEINAEIDLAEDTELTAGQLALCEEVNLERAAELWREEEIQFGIVGIGSEFGATHLARDTWKRYSIKLSSVKDQFGFA